MKIIDINNVMDLTLGEKINRLEKRKLKINDRK